MKKIFLSLIIGLIANSLLYSQYVDKALKFSMNEYGGTARFVGMGGAFGALGGDFSSIAINPAGLGVYRGSELVFSPGMSYNTNSSTYIGNKTDENGYMANLNNLGFVASYDLENSDTRWVNFNFGVGFNRITDLNNNIQFQGVNNSSLMEVFVNYANNDATPTSAEYLNGMYEYLLWDAFILDSAGGYFFNEIDDAAYILVDGEWVHNPAFEINQRKIIETEGAINEFSFSFGGNYSNKLYIGASIGIVKLRYDEYASHYEYETDAMPINYMYGFDFKEYSKTEGTGYTLKFGAIYKPVDYLRIGASLHLPTFYNLDQEFYNEVYGYFDEYPLENRKSQTQTYNYGLNSPLRALVSAGFQIGKIALIDVDYEYADYSTMEMDDEYNSQDVIVDNQNIKTFFKETHNFRAGAEFRYGPLYFRAGGRYSTSPYKDVAGVLSADYEKITLAGGLGYREKNFFIDFAFAQTTSTNKLIAYDWEYNNEEASIENKMNKFILTFGFKF